MIDPPRRSVTHFLVPFIDVTLILFSMFLLMPMGADENELEEAKKQDVNAIAIQEREQDIEDLQKLLQDRKQELEVKSEQLEQFLKQKDVYKQIVDLEKKLKEMQDERDRLAKERDLARKTLSFVRVIDIDAKTGQIFFFDPYLADPKMMLPDETAARSLIERHKKELKESNERQRKESKDAVDRQLYYQFIFPREFTGFPNVRQENEYKRWFTDVPNSLSEKVP